jgi:hypothetical protein
MISIPHVWLAVSRCLLVGAMVTLPGTAPANTDFSAGKTPEQLFNSSCSGCHRSPYGMAHGRNSPALTAFLREHYTTNAQWAGLLAGYLIRARPSTSRAHTTENWFLKIFWRIWREVSTTSWWLIGQLAKLLRV